MTPDVAPSGSLRQRIEALAQSLYEKSDPLGVAWARRNSVVREPWLSLARRQLSAAREADPP